jgi:SAM-dependent methyltransferase
MLSALASTLRAAVTANDYALRCVRHDHGVVYASLRRRLEQLFGERLPEIRVLDFGCGFTYPMVAMLHGSVGEVIGADVSPVFRDGLQRAVEWEGGWLKPGRAAEAIIEYLRASRYHRHLGSITGSPVRHHEYRILRSSGSEIPVEAESVDCVISNAVLQELPGDLSVYAREMARVLRPGGVIDLEWHSFYSWSGHYLGPEESDRNPWGHLLGGRYHPSLNRATPDQMKAAFAPYFDDVELLAHDRQYRIRGRDADYEPEGGQYLTPDLEARLADYPREWLLTRGYVLQGHRR